MPAANALRAVFHLFTILALLSPGGPAFAQTPAEAQPPAQASEESIAEGEPGWLRGWAPRRGLETAGVHLHLLYKGEAFTNISGGVRRGTVYEGLADFGLELNSGPLTHGGWTGASLFVNALQVHGANPTDKYTNSLFPVSNIEAADTTRLFEAWFQQELFAGQLSLRIGQLAADSEFATSDYGALFINGTFGWPEGIAANAPTPAYPMAALGVRLEGKPLENLTLHAAVFDGNPDSVDQFGHSLNPYGIRWRLSGDEGAFFIAELVYSPRPEQGRAMVWPLNKHQEMASAKQAVLSGRGRRSTYKVGGWYHTGNFPDNRTDEQGRFLGSALSTGKPQIRSGNWGLYIIADQMLWREKPDADEGLGLFGRLTYSPPDRSFYDFYADFGVTCTGLIAGRDDDSFGVAFAYGHISQDRRDVQRATGVWAQDHTAVLEVSYQVAVTPWWLIQPDFQYFLDPDGSSSRGSLPDAVVVGLRTQISF